MAQSSSAAREPSMEEILASIRRIIEDSDVSRKAVPDTPSFAPRGEIATFRRPEPVDENPAALQAEEAEKSAMMRSIFAEEPVLRGPLEEPSVSEADEEDDVVLDAQNDERVADTEIPASEAETPAETQIADDVVEPEAVAPTEEIVQTVAQADAEEFAAAAPVPSGPEAKAPAGPCILSQAAERQVAEAFQDLNHAVHAGPRRSFDDIATELLQPMLQDWLDKNLPGLVERLVREEIERVVRGSR